MKIGDNVIKNENTWEKNDFDSWVGKRNWNWELELS